MIMVSSCLAGINCRYDGNNNKIDEIAALVEAGKAIPVCPEVFGGMPTPRNSCEIVVDKSGNRRVVTEDGTDYTKEFWEGALKVLEIAKTLEIESVVLQQRSPSCGFGKIYDGSFSRKLIDGNGLAAELLSENGIKIYNNETYKEIME